MAKKKSKSKKTKEPKIDEAALIMRPGTYALPEVELSKDGQHLVWFVPADVCMPDAMPAKGRDEHERQSALRDFLRIPKSGVMEFAEGWGVLGLCEAHGFPSTHAGAPCGLHKKRGKRPSGVSGTQYLEPLAAYAALAAEAAEILEKVYRGRWSVDAERINMCLRRAQLRIEIDSDKIEPEIRADGLYGDLMLALTDCLAHAERMAECGDCGIVFLRPLSRGKPPSNPICPECLVEKQEAKAAAKKTKKAPRLKAVPLPEEGEEDSERSAA